MKFFTSCLLYLSAFLIIVSFFNLEANSKPAKPGLLEVRQPDGTTVRATLHGNFHHNWAVSEDGFILVADKDEYLSFATFDSKGDIVSSGIRARNIESRDTRTNVLLSSIRKKEVAEAIQKNISNKKPISTRGVGLAFNKIPHFGDQRGLVILVEYPNQGFTIGNPNKYFSRMLNEEDFSDYGSTGSARDFFITNSSGNYRPTFDVYGPVMLANNYSYYGGRDDLLAYEMVIEACRSLEDEIDFSLYDTDEDGVIDNVYIFYAGFGEADGGDKATVWPHSWDLSEANPDQEYYIGGLRLNHYACSNELQFDSDFPDGIGSFIHEFSHVLGLPDLYDIYGGNSFTPGSWSILDVGSYNNNSRTPPNYSAYERAALDWLTPVELTEDGTYTLENLADSNTAYKIRTENEHEFFLLENRQQTGNDTYLPGHGMLVWHIDFNQHIWDINEVNANRHHQRVDLIEADDDLTPSTIDGDSFPGAMNVTELTCTTSPYFLTWENLPVSFDIREISESTDGVITFFAEGCADSNVASIQDNPSTLRIEGNMIYLTEGHGEVYDISGKKVSDLSSSPTLLPSGFYLITTPSETNKIVIP